MNDLKDATLRDKLLIQKITEGLDLKNPSDIEKVYNELQSGLYNFESQVGRDFDDKIYELYHEGVKVSSKKSLPKNVSSKSFSQKTVKADVDETIKKYGDRLNPLIEIELKKKEKRRKVMILLATLVAVASLGYFGVYYYMSSQNVSDTEELADLRGNDVLAELADKKAQQKNAFALHKQEVVLPDMLDEYKTLFAKNSDLIGWLNIEGTKIDYPVMQTTDNDFYLKHNFGKDKDSNGALFLDCACTAFPRSTNMIIYGHHMKSGNMFGNLQKYAKESYGKEHSIITFDTIYEKATYQVMYVFYSKVYDNDDLVFKYYQFVDANSQKEFDYYMEEMKALSLYDTGVRASYGDTLLTLSTCDHSQTDGRFAVVAKRID